MAIIAVGTMNDRRSSKDHITLEVLVPYVCNVTSFNNQMRLLAAGENPSYKTQEIVQQGS